MYEPTPQIEDIVQTTVYNRCFPSRFYDFDGGSIILVLTSPIELPFKAYQTAKNLLCHAARRPHRHRDSLINMQL